jgi:hypothetical protein
VGLEELTPGCSLTPFRSWFDAVPLQDVGCCRSANAVTDILQGALDSSVAPARVLSGHSDGQVRDDLHDPASPWGSPLVGPFLDDELPVPAKDRVWSDERCNFGEGASTDRLSAHRESSTLSVARPESSFPELLLEDSVLLAEEFDDRILLTSDPSGQGGDEDLAGLEYGGHRLILPIPRGNQQLPAGGDTGYNCPGNASIVFPDSSASS